MSYYLLPCFLTYGLLADMGGGGAPALSMLVGYTLLDSSSGKSNSINGVD